MRRGWATILGVIGALALVVGIDLFADARLADFRLDLTAQRLYTLSDGTRTILRGLKDPVTLRLFYSRDLGAAIPLYGTYADRVREMLRQYASVSGGKLKLEFYDPEPFSDVEDRAMGYGLQGVPVDQSGEQVYFGLVGTNLLDDERTIAFVQPDRERFLEYDLTKLVYDLSNPSRPVVGLLSSLPLDGDPRAAMMAMRGMGSGGRPWASIRQLREAVTVKPVATDATTIDPDIQTLLVAEPQPLPEATLYAIDQFVMRGGRLMAMVDPYSEAASASPTPPPAPGKGDAGLAKLLNAWGVVYDPGHVVADLTGAWRVRANPGDRIQAVDYPVWFNIRDGISPDDPATADLKQITLASAGALEKKQGADIAFTPLLASSPRSGLLPTDLARTPDPTRVLAVLKPDGKPHVVAARVRGVLKSAFAGPPAPPPAPGDKPAPALPAYRAQTDGPANLVVVADTDILADRFWVRMRDFFGQEEATPFSDNGPLVANLVGTLAGGDVLLGLRSRGASLRPFGVVQAMQSRAEAEFRQSERTLQQHLDATEKQLRELRRGSGSGEGASAVVVTPEQRAAIDRARQDVLETRQQLRAVQLNLNREIAALKTRMQLLSIALVPALLTIAALALHWARRRRRARARGAPTLVGAHA